MFVDGSAIAAMLGDETKARLLAGRLQTAPKRFTAPACLVRATALVAEANGLERAAVHAVVERFCDAMGIRPVTVPATLAAPAADAMDRFGLSPERALVYAAARYYRVPLLFDDPAFARTDVTPG